MKKTDTLLIRLLNFLKKKIRKIYNFYFFKSVHCKITLYEDTIRGNTVFIMFNK